jgi:hypothetical protein
MSILGPVSNATTISKEVTRQEFRPPSSRANRSAEKSNSRLIANGD